MTASEGVLGGVRVIDLTDERAIYGAKLLADLGADVVRIEPPEGDPLRARGPHHDAAGEGTTSLWHAWFASNRRFFSVDLSAAEGRDRLFRLIEAADIVIACRGAFGVEEAQLDAARERRPELVVVDVSSFGDRGPWRDFLAPDLVAGALGGAIATTGAPDTPPLKTFGELNFITSGSYAAIAALAALYRVRAAGQGQRVAVSVHECIASCLEQVFMFYWYGERMGRERVLPRQGSTHWSGAYTVMKARGGSIMVTPTPDFEAQLMWLIEEDAQQDLIDPKYLEPENLPLLIQRMMEVLREWVAEKDVEQLFFEAQARHAPYGWVLPLERVAENPQLEARQWYRQYRIGAAEVRAPGAPYRFSRNPDRLRDYAGPGSDTESLLAEIGWEDAS